MKRTMTIMFFCLALAVSALAQGGQKPAEQKSTDAMPTVDQILDKYVQAIGGKAAIEKQTSRVTKGTFEIPEFGASGTLEIYEKAPNKTLSHANIAGFGDINEGFNGTVAWAQDPQSGLREKSGAELADTKRDAEFHKPIKMKQLYSKITVKGKEKVGDKEAYHLEAVPSEGATEQWYFDVQTGLLIRQDAERESPQGKVPIQIYMDNYKEVDGVKLPFTLRQVSPMFNLNIKVDDVKHNVAVDDAKFNKPSGQ